MTWKQIFTSSVGKKLVMGATGFFLITFLIAHVGINACIFWNDGGDTFNKAAHFMGTNIFIRTAEIGLFVGLLLHIIQGLALVLQNKKLRPVGYAVTTDPKGSKWYSRSMGLLGTLLLFFLIIHLYHFWVPSRFTGLEESSTLVDDAGLPMHDLYAKMQEVFTAPHSWWVVIVYVLACASLCYHLLHGFTSAFRTFGLTNSKFLSLVQVIGFGYSIIVSLLFAAMPIVMHLKLIN
jgi:succinate dehydrogenase / fumarate reductase, cytochrome b subunit